MKKFATLLIVALLSGLVGGGAGYFLGRSSVPAASSPVSSVTEERAVVTATGQESVNNAPDQKLDPAKPEKRAPVTAATLRAELASLESGGFGGVNAMRKYADLQERLKVSDLPAIAAEMCSGNLTGKNGTGLFLVLGAYAEADPQGAWNFALGIKQPGMRQNAIMSVMSNIVGKDPNRAIALADSLTEPQLKMQIRSMAISGLAQKDPQRALALVTASPNAREGDSSLFMIFNQWGQKDPEAAKAAVARLSGRQAEQARQALVSTLAQQDPKAAWAYAATLPASNSRNPYGDPRVQVIQNWAQSDPQSALKAALTIGETPQRSQAVASAVNAWAGTDFPAALSYAISIEDAGIRGNILQNLSQNPNANRKDILQAVLEHVPPGDTFQQAVSGVFSNWARENPSAAAAAAMQLPAGRTFTNVASQIASQWMSSTTNKQEVFDWVRSLPPGEARANSMSSVFSTWSGEDPQAAARALPNLTSEERKSVVQSVASGWGRISPNDALKWSSTLADPGERTNAIRSIVSQWAGSDPAAAAKYVAAMPESERAAPMENVVSNWASRDSESAAAWLDRQPAGPSKDGALRALSRKIAQEDPEAALTWVAGISDEKQRLQQTESIARDWIRQDPTTARSWIASSKLPEDTRNKLLK
ncbi:MAG: hypothetical protein WCO94_10355 [Verrucomicrobiota bacterium]